MVTIVVELMSSLVAYLVGSAVAACCGRGPDVLSTPPSSFSGRASDFYHCFCCRASARVSAAVAFKKDVFGVERRCLKGRLGRTGVRQTHCGFWQKRKNPLARV